MSIISTLSSKTIEKASDILLSGGLVAVPTETVYGLAANALNGEAVASIFAAKERPSFNPLISHFYDINQMNEYVEINDTAKLIAQKFWPGALTMILPKKQNNNISDLVTAGLETMAVRIPANKAMINLLKEVNVPLAAPSANKSGTPSPTTAKHVADSLGDKIDLIIAAGKCEVGIESTIIDLTSDKVIILRAGIITAEDIESVIGYKPEYDFGNHDKPKSPGQILKHYSPSIPIRLNAIDVKEGEALLAFGSIKFMGLSKGGFAKDLPDYALKNLSETGDLYEAAANLFAMLRDLDNDKNKSIAIMNIPNENVGIAINDRIKRASIG